MSGQVQFSGSMVASPAQSSDNQFPSSLTNVPFSLNPALKTYNVDTGCPTVVINSPSAYVTLPGIGGAVGPVTEALFVYLRSAMPFLVRVTYKADATLYISKINGLLVIEVDPANPIVLVEVKGAGTIEYLATGNQ